jgi:hypothetical protein
MPCQKKKIIQCRSGSAISSHVFPVATKKGKEDAGKAAKAIKNRTSW